MLGLVPTYGWLNTGNGDIDGSSSGVCRSRPLNAMDGIFERYMEVLEACRRSATAQMLQ